MVFDNDEEYLDRKKREYAMKGLEIVDEQAIIDDRHDAVRLFWLLGLGFWAIFATLFAILFFMLLIAVASQA